MISITLLAFKNLLSFVSCPTIPQDVTFILPKYILLSAFARQLAVIKYLFTHLTAPTGIAKSFNLLSKIRNANELSGKKVGRSLLRKHKLKTGWPEKQKMN